MLNKKFTPYNYSNSYHLQPTKYPQITPTQRYSNTKSNHHPFIHQNIHHFIPQSQQIPSIIHQNDDNISISAWSTGQNQIHTSSKKNTFHKLIYHNNPILINNNQTRITKIVDTQLNTKNININLEDRKKRIISCSLTSRKKNNQKKKNAFIQQSNQTKPNNQFAQNLNNYHFIQANKQNQNQQIKITNRTLKASNHLLRAIHQKSLLKPVNIQLDFKQQQNNQSDNIGQQQKQQQISYQSTSILFKMIGGSNNNILMNQNKHINMKSMNECQQLERVSFSSFMKSLQEQKKLIKVLKEQKKNKGIILGNKNYLNSFC